MPNWVSYVIDTSFEGFCLLTILDLTLMTKPTIRPSDLKTFSRTCEVILFRYKDYFGDKGMEPKYTLDQMRRVGDRFLKVISQLPNFVLQFWIT